MVNRVEQWFSWRGMTLKQDKPVFLNINNLGEAAVLLPECANL
jgi:hypothetical protein